MPPPPPASALLVAFHHVPPRKMHCLQCTMVKVKTCTMREDRQENNGALRSAQAFAFLCQAKGNVAFLCRAARLAELFESREQARVVPFLFLPRSRNTSATPLHARTGARAPRVMPARRGGAAVFSREESIRCRRCRRCCRQRRQEEGRPRACLAADIGFFTFNNNDTTPVTLISSHTT